MCECSLCFMKRPPVPVVKVYDPLSLDEGRAARRSTGGGLSASRPPPAGESPAAGSCDPRWRPAGLGARRGPRPVSRDAVPRSFRARERRRGDFARRGASAHDVRRARNLWPGRGAAPSGAPARLPLQPPACPLTLDGAPRRSPVELTATGLERTRPGGPHTGCVATAQRRRARARGAGLLQTSSCRPPPADLLLLQEEVYRSPADLPVDLLL